MKTLLVFLLTSLATLAHAGENSPGVIGCWYSGDGTGVNLNLDLRANDQYTLTWNGCLGVYGTAEGTWSLRNGEIVFRPSKETDMLTERRIRILRIVRTKKGAVLVEPENEASVKEDGPDDYNSFSRVTCEAGT